MNGRQTLAFYEPAGTINSLNGVHLIKVILYISFFVQIVSGTLWVHWVTGQEGIGLETIFLFMVISVVQLIGFVIGVIAYRKLPPKRKLAIWAMALPVPLVLLPVVIRQIVGDALPPWVFAILLVVAVLAFLITCYVFPRKVARYVPGFLFRSRGFNGLVLVLHSLGLILPAGVIVLVMLGAVGTGEAAGMLALMAFIFLGWMELASLFVIAWARVGLHSQIEGACRSLHIKQIVVSALGLLIGLILMILMFAWEKIF